MYNVSVSLDSKIYKIKNKIIKVNQLWRFGVILQTYIYL